MSDVETVPVGGEAPYSVDVGRGLLPRLDALLGPAGQVAVVGPRALAHTSAVVRAVEASGRKVLPLEVPPGEAAKTADELGG